MRISLIVLLSILIIGCAAPTPSPSPTPTPTPTPTPIPTPPAQGAYIDPIYFEGSKGEEIDFYLKVKIPEAVSGGEAVIKFDPGVFELVSVDVGDIFGEDPLIGVEEADGSKGVIRYALARKGRTYGKAEGSFIKFRLKIKEEAGEGEYKIRIEKMGLCDENFEDITFGTYDSTVKVIGE